LGASPENDTLTRRRKKRNLIIILLDPFLYELCKFSGLPVQEIDEPAKRA
jgi:hypothetical protein